MTADRRVFLDSNVLIYILSDDRAKATAARSILKERTLDRLISTQVIGEVADVARRKGRRTWQDIKEFTDVLKAACSVELVQHEDQYRAFEIAHATGYSWWDSQMIATAARMGAQIVYSEDLQLGRKVGPLAIINPFAI